VINRLVAFRKTTGESMNYPDETNFENIPYTPSDFEDWSDVEALRRWFEEYGRGKISGPDEVEFEDWLLNFMGITFDTTLLIFETPHLVTDPRYFGYQLCVRNLARNYEYEVEDIREFFVGWTDGVIVPATKANNWVERREPQREMYGLFRKNPQDSNNTYLLYGNPVTVDTRDRTRSDIRDAVMTKVTQQNEVVFDIGPDENLFIAEFSEFPE